MRTQATSKSSSTTAHCRTIEERRLVIKTAAEKKWSWRTEIARPNPSDLGKSRLRLADVGFGHSMRACR